MLGHAAAITKLVPAALCLLADWIVVWDTSFHCLQLLGKLVLADEWLAASPGETVSTTADMKI